jgi:hypothetical protein
MPRRRSGRWALKQSVRWFRRSEQTKAPRWTAELKPSFVAEASAKTTTPAAVRPSLRHDCELRFRTDGTRAESGQRGHG